MKTWWFIFSDHVRYIEWRNAVVCLVLVLVLGSSTRQPVGFFNFGSNMLSLLSE